MFINGRRLIENAGPVERKIFIKLNQTVVPSMRFVSINKANGQINLSIANLEIKVSDAQTLELIQ
ncbi:hypothetical protein [Metabacillus fastidiosus]|uniref:Uncharacterized protein n=1 Tax=Metabacillus fastidiosus TaxID=1458 RepID=A0ABU6NT66_9BACI|nr:hypothetical protein [Metabacillus fastidiosus]MED4400340.1 hypothetical protein [Metabacillus fastidiosus]